MKFPLAAAVLLAQSSSCSSGAFVPSPAFSSHSSPSSSALFSRPDASEAVKAAMEATEKFGKDSKEARLAWEDVEEMDSSDNSVAYAGGIDEDECLVESPEPACEEYYTKLEELTALIEAQKPNIEKVKTLAAEVKNVKLSQPDSSAERDSPAIRKALAEARAATDEFGIESSQARVAWEALEEIASSDLSAATKGTLDEECLVETIEACEAIEELERALQAEK